jgi:hypothetical protein
MGRVNGWGCGMSAVIQANESALQKEVEGLVSFGCVDYSKRLGIVNPPHGYALILNSDGSHFFFLRWDGSESCENWNKWAVYRWMKLDSVDPHKMPHNSYKYLPW